MCVKSVTSFRYPNGVVIDVLNTLKSCFSLQAFVCDDGANQQQSISRSPLLETEV